MRFLRFFDLPILCFRHRELLWSFIFRDLKARYEGSLLGRLWPIINPLLLFCVYFFVFVIILNMRFSERGEVFGSDALMGLFIISGILPWVFFTDCTTRSAGVVLENGNLVKKIAFPSQLLVVYAVAVNLIYFLIGLAVFLAIRLIFFYDLGVAPWGEVLVGLPSSWPIVFVAVVLQAIFSVGFGLLLGSLNIFVRDVEQIAPLALNFWFFTTPIVYPVSLIEDNLPNYEPLMKLNPMYHLMEMYHSALIFDHGVVPWESAGIFALFALGVFIPGYAFFRSTKGRFADEI